MRRLAVNRPGARSHVSMGNLFGGSAIAMGQRIVKTHRGTS